MGSTSRSESEAEEMKPQASSSSPAPLANATSPSVPVRTGREPSVQESTGRSKERSRSRESPLEMKDSQKRRDAAYLKRIMADTNTSKSPLELLKSGLGAGSSTNGDSITATAASWLRLGPVNGPSLMHCLRQFTNVESLEGENMVGCSRCWKLANPGYVSKRRRRSGDSSSSSSDDSSPEDDEKPLSNGKPTHPVLESQSRSRGNSSSVTTPSDGSESFLETGRSSVTTQAGDSYKGPLIPSISTTPAGLSPPILLNGRHERNGASKVSSSSVTYLTPSSSRHGSIRRPSSPSTEEIADNDSTSATSVSDVSARHSKREARGKEPTTPTIPKSQRVVLRKAFKRYLIAVPPPVLVIREKLPFNDYFYCLINILDLKRFQRVSRTPVAVFGALKKIDDFIAFPEYLDLKPFIAPRREEFGLRPPKIRDHKGAYDKQVLYRLYAVVVHIGNMVSKYSCVYRRCTNEGPQLGGHYVAYTALPSPTTASPVSETAKTTDPPRKWSFQSDQVVRVASLEEVLAARAYLCFYERISELPASALVSPTQDGQRKK